MTRHDSDEITGDDGTAAVNSAVSRRGVMTAVLGAGAAGIVGIATATPAQAGPREQVGPPGHAGPPFAPREHTHDGGRLGQDEPVSTLRAVEAYSRQYPRIDVALFGAVGDGVTDDSVAIQEAMDSATERRGIVAFDSDKVYAISQTIVVDVSAVRGIEGNLARIKLTADVTAFRITGTHTGNASPNNSSARRIKLPEMHPYVRGLRIHGDPQLRGTGLRIEGTFGLQVLQCHLFDLRTGIEFAEVNRNVILANNNVWHCLDYGIWWNGGNIHQMNMTGNHISYTRKALFMDDALIYNVQVVGNAIEASSAPGDVEYVVHAVARDGYIEGLELIGNSLEDHVNVSGAAVRIDGGPNRRGKQIMIIGNDMGNSESSDIFVSDIDEVVIANNTMSYSTDYSIRLTGHVLAVNITGNVMHTRDDRPMGMLHIGGEDARTTVDALVVANNIAKHMMRIPVVVRNADLRSVNFSGNVIEYVGNEPGHLVDMTESVSLRGASITGNQLRTERLTSAIAVDPRDVDLLVAKDNVSDGVGPDAFASLPDPVDGRVIVADNVAG